MKRKRKSRRIQRRAPRVGSASITFANGSKITFAKTKGPSIRGMAAEIIGLDVPNSGADARTARAGDRR